MSYLFKQKVNLLDFVNVQVDFKRISILVEDQDLLQLYARLLAEENFVIYPCYKLSEIHEHLKNKNPHLLLINLLDLGPTVLMQAQLKLLRTNFPDIKLVSLGLNTHYDTVKLIMDLGIISHIERNLSRPEDVGKIIKAILK